MKKVLFLAAALSVAGLVACGGGGGGGGNGGGGNCCYNPNPTPPPHYWSHSELANEFVRRVNNEIANFDVTLVKTWTLQSGYIVVWDHQYGSYDAYYVDAFNPAGSISSYFNAYENWFYYDLTPEWGGTYYDPVTGTRFQKDQDSTKNLGLMKAFKEKLAINKMVEKLQADYGLSADKAELTANFAYKLMNSQAGTYKEQDYDSFAKELTGSTISEFQKDFSQGNWTSLKDRIDLAGEQTGMGPEGVNKLIKDMFLQ